MQTFLPSPSFILSARILDYRRLGKQRVEAKQILLALENPKYGWQNHPAVNMWRGHKGALQMYYNIMLNEWKRRGYNNTMQFILTDSDHSPPAWLGDPAFHASHRSNLLRKDKGYYSQFNWTEPDNLEYVWPRV